MKLLFCLLALTGSLSAKTCEETTCNVDKASFSYFPDLRNTNSFRAYYTMLCYMDKSLGPLTFVPYPSCRFPNIKDELDYLIFFDYFIAENGRLIKRNFADLPRHGGDDLFDDFRKALKDDFVPQLTD